MQPSQKRRKARSEKTLIIWLEDLRKRDIQVVGGKNENLGEMIQAGISVPPGLAFTAYNYEKFIVETGISERIYSIMPRERETVADMNIHRQLEEASRKVRALIDQLLCHVKLRLPSKTLIVNSAKERNWQRCLWLCERA